MGEWVFDDDEELSIVANDTIGITVDVPIRMSQSISQL